MALYPGVPLPDPNIQFLDDDGNPLALGSLTFYTAGTTTLQDTFNDSDLAPGHENTNPVVLDAAGRSATPIYLSATGYKVVAKDADGVTLWTRDEIEGWNVFPSTWGTLLGTGVTYTDGDTILTTTRLALVDSSAGSTTVYLSPASDMTQPLTVKNRGTNTVTVTVDGTDTIEVSLSSITLPAASTPTFPSVMLASDGISNITILASHGM